MKLELIEQLEEERRATDPADASFRTLRQSSRADAAMVAALACSGGVLKDAVVPCLKDAPAKPWPDPSRIAFSLDISATDPHNPSNRSAPLRRRSSDR